MTIINLILNFLKISYNKNNQSNVKFTFKHLNSIEKRRKMFLAGMINLGG